MTARKRMDALRPGSGCTRVGAAVWALAAAVGAVPAGASSASGTPAGPVSGAAWASLGLLGGTTRPDPRLGAYQWDVGPRAAFGAQALAGTGRYGAGLRVWRTETTQALGLADVPRDPAVRSTRWELVQNLRLARAGATALSLTSGLGRLRVSYAPDRIETDPYATGTPVTVELKPLSTWIGGFGFAARRPIASRWTTGLELEQRFYGWNTAHRSGDTIVTGRERFGEWSARLELAWLRTGR